MTPLVDSKYNPEQVVKYNRKHNLGYPEEGQDCVIAYNFGLAFLAKYSNDCWIYQNRMEQERVMSYNNMIGWMPLEAYCD